MNPNKSRFDSLCDSTVSPLHVEKIVALRERQSTLFLTERIANEAGQRVEFLWGHHPTFGGSLLEPGTRIFVPPCNVIVPDILPPDARLIPNQHNQWPIVQGIATEQIDLSIVPGYDSGSHDFVRLEILAAGWFTLVNVRRRLGFALRFDEELFRVLGYWQLFAGGPNYPWYKQHFLAALEPASDLPSLSESVASGSAIALESGGTIQTTIEATAFTDRSEVHSVGPGGIIS